MSRPSVVAGQFQFDAAQLTQRGSVQRLLHDHLNALATLNYSPDTCNKRYREVMEWAAWMAERDVLLAAEVTRPMIERYQRYVYSYRKANGKALAIKSQREKVKSVEMFFRWCVRHHRVPSNPAADLEYPRAMKTLPMVLTQDEVWAVLVMIDTATPVGVRDRALIETLYSTGMRRSEITKLRCDDVDLSAGIIRVVQGKGHKDRLVPLGASAVFWVQRYLDEVRPVLVAADVGAVDSVDAVQNLFVSRIGLAFVRENLAKVVRDYVNAAPITKKGSCHLFRHSMATHLLENGCDIRLIQEMLGHSSLDTTAHYAHVAITQMKRAHDACHPLEQPRKAAEDSADT